MEIQSADNGGVMVIGVSGRLDSNTSDALEKEMRTQIAAGGTRMVFDLKALDFVSSAGMRVFMMAARTLRGKGSLALAAPQPKVRQILEIAAMDTIMPIYGSAADAVAALRS